MPVGRWSLWRNRSSIETSTGEAVLEQRAQQLLRRYGIVFRDLLALGRREADHIAHAFPEVSRRVGGYLIDVISNMWAVKAFSARTREKARLAEHFGGLTDQGRSGSQPRTCNSFA